MGAVYTQLSIEEHRSIERWRHAKVPVREMTRVLQRSKATIHRELKRNFFSDECMPKWDGYYGAAAHVMAADRRARQCKLIRHPVLLHAVIDRLKNGWTPEQIGNRMIHEGAQPRVCQETIYRYLYSKEGMAQALWWYLPNHRKAAGRDMPARNGLRNLTGMSVFSSPRTPPLHYRRYSPIRCRNRAGASVRPVWSMTPPWRACRKSGLRSTS